MKKLKLFLLILLMVITILPINTIAEGEDASSKEPDLSVYATKEQLMDGTFAPNENGVPENIGKIVFGKNNTGAPQEWYILGKDNGITNGEGKVIDNTVIFAADNIDNSSFEPPINYNNSDIREYMQAMVNVNGTKYFTSSEIGLMNDTTIETDASKYVTDKLYLLATDGCPSGILLVGSNNQIKIAMPNYWQFGTPFWLRTTYMGDALTVLYASPSKGVLTTIQNQNISIRPASNLSLTNVLFASAAIAGSPDIIESDTVMRLRLNGKDKNIGEVYYDEDAKEIIVSKGTVENKVHLIIQGKGSSPYYKQNWYYSKEITGTETIKASDIKQALGLSSVPSLANSKIWLEITDEDQRMIYAVQAKAVQEISSVDVVDIAIPEANKDLDTTATCNTTGVTVDSITWEPKHTTAGYNETYTVSIKLSAASGYKFADNVLATVNEKVATSEKNNSNASITVTYEFDPTAKDIFDSIPAMSMEVDSADDIDTKKFPTEAEVIGKSGIVYKVGVVEWRKNSNNPLEYEGILDQLPEVLKHNFNDAPATVKLTLTVKPAEVVPTPTPTVITTTTDDGYVVPNTGVK